MKKPNCRNREIHPVLSLTLAVVASFSIATCSAGAEGREEIPGIASAKVAALDTGAASFDKPIKPVKVLEGDHVASGISLRNRGGGVINLRGAPRDASALGAFLYWDFLADEGPDRLEVSLNGVSIEGQKVGEGATPCWSPPRNFAYRAEVPLYLLYTGINGDYKVAGVPSAIGTGSNPWQAVGAGPMAEGATLVVFYGVPGVTNKTTLVYDTPVSGQEFSGSFSTTLLGFTAPSSTAKFTLVGADGQAGGSLQPPLTDATTEKSYFQGSQIAGPGGSNNDSDWNGQDTEPLSQLWDTRTQVVRIEQGSTSAEVRYESNGDCLVVVAFILTL